MSHSLNSLAAVVLAGVVVCLAAGCSSPSKANIELRKQNQLLESKLVQAEHRVEADQRVIAGLRETYKLVLSSPATVADAA